MGRVVSHNGALWQTVEPTTAGQEPSADLIWDTYCGPMALDAYDDGTTYNTGEIVSSGGYVYLSLNSSNDAAPGTTSWVALGTVAAASKALTILYPIGSGPSSQINTRNVYRLPNGYLRNASADPKQGVNARLGAPGNRWSDDWKIESDYIVTADIGPLFFRFVADTTVVSRYDPMFCEGLACRIGLEVCEILTQDDSKLSTIASIYKQFMGEARTINSIEAGPTEADEDEWITVRY